MLLDRFIIRQFLTNAALLLVFLAALIVMVDFSLNFDEYTGQARASIRDGAAREAIARGADAGAAAERALREAGALRVGVLAVGMLADLWWPRMFLLAAFLLGPVLVGALGFTCSQLVRSREVVALLAGGVSLWRVARPMLIATGACIALQAVNRELIVPELAPLLTRDKKEAGRRELGVFSDFVQDARGRLLYFRRADLDKGEVDGLYVWERDGEGLMTRRISATSARWQDGAWRLTDGRSVSRRPEGPQSGPGTRIAPTSVEVLETDVDPTALRLRRFEGMAANLSMVQLGTLIASARAQPDNDSVRRRVATLERIRWGRVSALACIALAMVVCLPFFLRKEPANMIVQSLYAAPIALGAFAATLVGTTTAVPGLPASVSVFLPALALVPLSVAAVASVRT
jgi:lipopolysaccharide export system permease protein